MYLLSTFLLSFFNCLLSTGVKENLQLFLFSFLRCLWCRLFLTCDELSVCISISSVQCWYYDSTIIEIDVLFVFLSLIFIFCLYKIFAEAKRSSKSFRMYNKSMQFLVCVLIALYEFFWVYIACVFICNLLDIPRIWGIHNNVPCRIYSNIFWNS